MGMTPAKDQLTDCPGCSVSLVLDKNGTNSIIPYHLVPVYGKPGHYDQCPAIGRVIVPGQPKDVEGKWQRNSYKR